METLVRHEFVFDEDEAGWHFDSVRGEVAESTPLRLKIAAALAFPDGSMKASGLRRECTRDRLVVERIAGKDYTTLAHIQTMRKLCRVEAKAYGLAAPRLP